jgi:hypothetical protein
MWVEMRLINNVVFFEKQEHGFRCIIGGYSCSKYDSYPEKKALHVVIVGKKIRAQIMRNI